MSGTVAEPNPIAALVGAENQVTVTQTGATAIISLPDDIILSASLTSSSIRLHSNEEEGNPLFSLVADLVDSPVTLHIPAVTGGNFVIETAELQITLTGGETFSFPPGGGVILVAERTEAELWVDATSGDDLFALRGRSDRRFGTIAAAIAAASAGDVIHLSPGIFTLTGAIQLAGITLRGSGMATIITLESAGSLLQIIGDDTHLSDLVIDGYSPIEVLGGVTQNVTPWNNITIDRVRTQNGIDCIVVGNFLGRVDVSDSDLTSSYDITAGSGSDGSLIVFRGCRLYSSGAGGVAAVGGFNVEVTGCNLTAFVGFWVGGGSTSGTVVVTGSRIAIVETGSLGIVGNGGNLIIGGCVMDGSTNIGGLSVEGGICHLRGLNVDTSGNSTTSPITKSGGTLTLESVTLTAEGTRDGIEASTAQTVFAIGCYVNREVSANVTISPDGGLMTPSKTPLNSASNLNADKLASGTVPVASLPVTASRVTSDQTTSSTSLATVSGLTASVEANRKYYFRCEFHHVESAAGEGIGIAVNGPSGISNICGQVSIYKSANGTMDVGIINAVDTPVTGSTGVASVFPGQATGYFETGANAGTFAIRFKTETGGVQNATIKAGSFLILEEVP